MKLLSVLFLFSLPAFAETIMLKDFKYPVPDVAEKKLSKEVLFKDMNRSLVRVKDSICSNRAHVWSYEFQKKEVVAPKIFLFFTAKTGSFGGMSWWYHVSPMVNEGGKLWVMDAGFPKRFQGPVSVEAWLKDFNGPESTCKEILSDDMDLVKRMFKDESFPETTSHGKYNCYYKIAPPGYWIPSQLAKNLSGHDEDGAPVNFGRDVMEEGDVMQACIEASTNPLGWMVRSTRAKCRNFINH